MACISPDGKPTATGARMLRAIKPGCETPEEIARETGIPLFRVRSGLRDFTEAGFVILKMDKYKVTDKGAGFLA